MTKPDDRKSDDLKPPPLPEVTRLNRNVLLVAAMGVVVVVLAVSHVARSDRDVGAGRTATQRVEAGAVGSFLNDTARIDTGLPILPPAYPDDSQSTDPAPAEPAASRVPARAFNASQVQDPLAAYDLPPEPDSRELAYQRALRAALRARDNRAGWPQNMLSDLDASFTSDEYPGAEDQAPNGTPLREIAAPTSPRAPAVGLPRDRYQEFSAAAAEHAASTVYENARIREPISEYQVMAGTVLPAMLVTAMNSDMPGEILAQISRNIFDSQQHHLLIPRGTKVIGRYDNQVALGQSRVLIAWTRLILPDGRSISLPGLPTKDLRGVSGMHSEVDNHYTRLYGQAVLLSIIGAGAQLSQPRQSNVLVPSSAGQVAAGVLGQELSRISMETIRRSMDVRPTLQVKAGTPFYIFLERDLVLEGPYVDRRRSIASDTGRGTR